MFIKSRRLFLFSPALTGAMLLLGLVYPPLYAEEEFILGDDGFGFEETPWVEEKLKLPALPTDELIEFKVDQVAFATYIDPDSVSVGKQDQVTRYTVVLVSPSGVRNVYYEGIRCATKEYKTYAFSINNNPWQVINEPEWIYIEQAGTQAYRLDLYKYYLCDKGIVRFKVNEVLRALRYPEL